jgi:hypothetical protein
MKTLRLAVNRVLPSESAYRKAKAMETIELAVERLRRPLKADGSARVAPDKPAAAVPLTSVPAPQAFKAQLAESQLPIKTRVLCEYSPDVKAIVGGNTARPQQAVHVPFAIIASVLSGMVGAAGMAAAMWYFTHSANVPQAPALDAGAMNKSVTVEIPAVVAAATPVSALTPAVSAPKVELALPTVVAAVAAAPLASPVAVAPEAAQARELVDAWAKAWSARDVERYLGFYATGFVSEKGLARAAWESGRRKRLASQRVISVAVRDVKVEAQSADRMTVRFVQDYSADTYRELATPKKLLLVREAGTWRIAAEGADSAPGKAG